MEPCICWNQMHRDKTIRLRRTSSLGGVENSTPWR